MDLYMSKPKHNCTLWHGNFYLIENVMIIPLLGDLNKNERGELLYGDCTGVQKLKLL